MEQVNETAPLSALMDVDSVPAPITQPTAASMPDIEQHPPKTPPPSPPMKGGSVPANPTQNVSAQMPEPEQHFNTPISQQHLLPVRPTPKYVTKTKTASRADWVNTLWADISGQLRRFSVISPDLFDGLLLRKDTATGALILRDLRFKYEELRADRNLATVRVLVPQTPTGGVWQLLWTMKRHRDPNGRMFIAQTKIDPIGLQPHFTLQTYPDQPYSSTPFPLPPFVQDYGPGPADFDPPPNFDFDTMTRDLQREVDEGKWAG